MNFYHPAILALDQAAGFFHAADMLIEKNTAHRLAGKLQQTLLSQSPHKTNRRFLHAQWVWATGHIGLLYQLMRWFRLHEPQTQLWLIADKSANTHFLAKLAPFLKILPELPPSMADEAMHNAVFFGCPDGQHSLVDFNKLIERECRKIHFMDLTGEEQAEADALLARLGVKRPYIALQARKMNIEPARNVTNEDIDHALRELPAINAVSTGLDAHPINERFPTVLSLPDPLRASFLLTAACDHFLGSNSGAWTIAHSFRRPVTIINDHARSAWIYDT